MNICVISRDQHVPLFKVLINEKEKHDIHTLKRKLIQCVTRKKKQKKENHVYRRKNGEAKTENKKEKI